MKHILKYIFSTCLLISVFILNAQVPVATTAAIMPENIKPLQKDSAKVIKKDSVMSPKKDRYGLRIGIDLYKLTKGLYDTNYKGIELVSDYRLTKNYYLTAEIGSENKTTLDDRIISSTKGSYIKVGFDYNAYENWLNMENIISIGLRAGGSSFAQNLNSYKIYNPNQYWSETPWTQTNQSFKGLTAGWLEVVAGLKVKVYNNIFVGFSFRMNTLIFQKKPSDNFENLYIPGFNRTYAGNFGAGFNYTVTYFIPLYKKTVKPEKK